MDSLLVILSEKFRAGINDSFRFAYLDCWPQLS